MSATMEQLKRELKVETSEALEKKLAMYSIDSVQTRINVQCSSQDAEWGGFIRSTQIP